MDRLAFMIFFVKKNIKHLDIYTGETLTFFNWTRNALESFNVLSERKDLGVMLKIIIPRKELEVNVRFWKTTFELISSKRWLSNRIFVRISKNFLQKCLLSQTF